MRLLVMTEGKPFGAKDEASTLLPNPWRSHMKYLIALWLAVTAPLVYATCTYSNYCGPNGCVYCTTCCYGNQCNTTCN